MRQGKSHWNLFWEKFLAQTGKITPIESFLTMELGIPKNLKGKTDPKKRMLLNQLPKMLKAYGKSLQDFPAAVVVVVDLDDKDCLVFKQEMLDILNNCNPQPKTLFRIAIEEGEAWLLGDRNAVKAAYPRAKEQILNGYVQDSICGTWEKLADAVYPGGSQKLKQLGYPRIGQIKCEWANKIAPHLDVESNQSRSFQVFRDGIRNLKKMGNWEGGRGKGIKRMGKLV